MKKGEIRDHPIETGIRKRKILRVALAKFDPRKHFLRDRDHFGGKIETNWSCAALGRSARDITGTATDIQDRHLPGNFCGIEQWRNELTGRARPDRIVFIRDPFPTFVFEFRESVAHYESVKGEEGMINRKRP